MLTPFSYEYKQMYDDYSKYNPRYVPGEASGARKSSRKKGTLMILVKVILIIIIFVIIIFVIIIFIIIDLE